MLTTCKYVPNFALKSLINDFHLGNSDFFSFNIQAGSKKNSCWDNYPQITVKLCLLGESGVGKTSFLSCAEHGQLPKNLRETVATVGIECRFFHLDRLFRNKYVVNIRIDDTAGQEIYRSIAPMYFRKADGIFLLADTTRVETLLELENYWYKELKKINTKNIETTLVCNKLDSFENCDDDYRARFLRQATEIATKHQMPLFCTSAHRGDNIQEAVKNMLLRIFRNDALVAGLVTPTSNLTKKPKKSKCCLLD